jgi:hypothetical protein
MKLTASSLSALVIATVSLSVSAAPAPAPQLVHPGMYSPYGYGGMYGGYGGLYGGYGGFGMGMGMGYGNMYNPYGMGMYNGLMYPGFINDDLWWWASDGKCFLTVKLYCNTQPLTTSLSLSLSGKTHDHPDPAVAGIKTLDNPETAVAGKADLDTETEGAGAPTDDPTVAAGSQAPTVAGEAPQ